MLDRAVFGGMEEMKSSINEFSHMRNICAKYVGPLKRYCELFKATYPTNLERRRNRAANHRRNVRNRRFLRLFREA